MRRLENRIRRLEEDSSFKGYVDPFETASPQELIDVIDSFKQICKAILEAQEKCGGHLLSAFMGPNEVLLSRETHLVARAKLWRKFGAQGFVFLIKQVHFSRLGSADAANFVQLAKGNPYLHPLIVDAERLEERDARSASRFPR